MLCAGLDCTISGRNRPTVWCFVGYDGAHREFCDDCADFVRRLYDNTGLTAMVSRISTCQASGGRARPDDTVHDRRGVVLQSGKHVRVGVHRRNDGRVP